MRQSYNSKVNSFLCCSSIFVVTKMLSKVAIQKLIQPYPAGSFPISCCHGTMCNSIFLITKTKCIWYFDYSFCCWDVCRNTQVQEKKRIISIFIRWTPFFLFIGPESDHCLPLSLTHSLTDSLTHSLLFSKLY